MIGSDVLDIGRAMPGDSEVLEILTAWESWTVRFLPNVQEGSDLTLPNVRVLLIVRACECEFLSKKPIVY
jgi:hypothetical protein